MNWLKAPLAVAPDFTLSSTLSQYDYSIVVYMDDLLIVSYENKCKTRSLLRMLARIFDMFGICINMQKSILEPQKEVEFLGFVVCADG